jgi:hypothetical protein
MIGRREESMAVEPHDIGRRHVEGEPPIVERRRFERRSADRNQMLRTAASAAIAICGGFVVLYLFFAFVGTVNFKTAGVATGVSIVLAVVWVGGFYYRLRTDAIRTQRPDRERRGF